MLSVRDIKSRYGRIEVLHGVSFDVEEGEIVTLVGSNGAGKTTLLRALSGVQSTAAGSVSFAGRPIHNLRPHRRVLLGLSQVPEGRQVFGSLSVADNLRLGAVTRHDDAVRADLDSSTRCSPSWPRKCTRPPVPCRADNSRCLRLAGR